MGFLDKAKEQASQLAAKAQEGIKQGQAKLDDSQSRRRSEHLLAQFGAWTWAKEHGREPARADDELERLTSELQAFEAEHGPVEVPAPPSVDAPPPPPPGAAPPPPPPAGAAPPPPPPGAGAPPPPPGGTPPPPPPGDGPVPPPPPPTS